MPQQEPEPPPFEMVVGIDMDPQVMQILVQAILNQNVKWVHGTNLSQFDYLGFRYRTTNDSNGSLSTIERIAKIEEGCFFDETGFENETIIVEDYERRKQLDNPDFGTW